LIARGDVHVNDQLVTKLGVKINPDQDQVKIRGKLLSVSQKSYYIFYKPKGVVSTIKDTHGRKSVFDYVKGLPERVYPVGRLDFHSEGLMILTNDGQFMQKVSHPSYGVSKTYICTIQQTVFSQDIENLKKGAEVEGKWVKPLRVERGVNAHEVKFVLGEGRKREIREICHSYGLKVERLIRTQIGNLKLGDLKSGELRRLTAHEIENIFA